MVDQHAEADTTEEIVNTLVENEGGVVTLHFAGEISVPCAPGVSHRTETLSETTMRVVVELAEIEDYGETLICFVDLDSDELERLGADPDAFAGPPRGPAARLEIHAMRETGAADDTDALPPWDGRPTVRVDVGGPRAPSHEVGTLSAVEVVE